MLGNADPSDAVHVVFQRGPTLASCTTVDHDGTVVVRLTLKGDGNVGNAVVVSSTFADAAVGTCVTNQTRGWTFGKPKGGLASLEQSFTFTTR